MASSSFMLALSLMILLVSTQNLSSVAVVAASALPAQIPGVSSVASSKPTKVSVALYHEAFCPGCTDFIVKYFPKIFLSGITDIMDLKLVPYGNAIVGENNTIICQHGSEECFLNQVEACAIHAWPDMEMHSYFIYCVEDLILKEISSEWFSCLKKPGFSARPILELQYGNETNALIPSLQFVPWLTVNSAILWCKFTQFSAFDNLLKAVCNAYKATPLPRVCQEPTTDINPEAKSNSNQEVCYVDEASPTAKVRSPGTTWRRLMKF
ncbi:hypothetical protein MKW98_020945 [Papaver atlanticum]|uniref:Gamma-interferon-inducible lysosomal thiol reductase n=1 Tax=Papaver atlanticum TaxID=357466 RepID=A0AAD4T9Y1_9MAGN|nr:hypothetical protein MKW98_020945 [Papaver atlanticum]